jgi:mRNA interferase RelE/StbE
MIYNVVLSHKAEKGLDKIPYPWQGRIIIVLKKLASDPHIGKKLEGKYKNDYSIRVWTYRIIYTIKKKELIIEVIEIEHRGGAYRE